MRCYVANARKRLFLVEARLQNLNCKCRQNLGMQRVALEGPPPHREVWANDVFVEQKQVVRLDVDFH